MNTLLRKTLEDYQRDLVEMSSYYNLDVSHVQNKLAVINKLLEIPTLEEQFEEFKICRIRLFDNFDTLTREQWINSNCFSLFQIVRGYK